MIHVAYIIVIFIFVIIVFYLHNSAVISERRLHFKQRNIKKEREATAGVFLLSHNILTTSSSDEEFLTRFTEYALRSASASGAAFLFFEDGERLKGGAVAGTFPPLKEVPEKVEQRLLAHAQKHTDFIKEMSIDINEEALNEFFKEKMFALFSENDLPEWFPKNFSKEAKRTILVPIWVEGKIFGVIIVVSRDDFDAHTLAEADGVFLVRLASIAALSLGVIRIFREKQEYAEQIQWAREEGMIQVSTGIIHNIGNAVTVAKLSVNELLEKNNIAPEERPEQLIVNELLPTLKRHVVDGNIADFLTTDEVGSQYFDIMAELLSHMGKESEGNQALLKSLNTKLHHISEIIELQQRFVGELGTENLTQLASVVHSTIKIFEETFNKRGVTIETDIATGIPEVLIDSSMMTQVFMNLIKNAVEAMESEEGVEKEHFLTIRLAKEYDEEKKEWAVVTIKDNGPGMSNDVRCNIFNFGFSTKGNEKTRGYGLHSCLDTVEKYGGKINVESEVGKGTTFFVYLPIKAEA